MKLILLKTALFLLMVWNGMIISAFISSLFIPKMHGFAGGVTIFWYAVFGALIVGIGTLAVVNKISKRAKQAWLIIASIIAVLLVAGLMYRINSLENKEPDYKNKPVTQPTLKLKLINYAHNTTQKQENVPGIGFAFVKFQSLHPLYFYSTGQLDVDPFPDAIVDSVTFQSDNHQITIATAPPWLVSEYLKMDYDVFMFKVMAITQNRIQVEVNKQLGKKLWLNLSDVSFMYWPKFILNANSIEAIDSEANPVKIKPLDHATTLSSQGNTPLRPLAVTNEWVLVSTNGLADRIAPAGWIRWKKEGSILITYSLFE